MSVSVNCDDASLETSVTTFVNHPKTVTANVQRVDVSQGDVTEAFAVIDIGALALPHQLEDEWMETTASVIVTSLNQVRLKMNSSNQIIDLQHTYVLPSENENAMFYSLQQIEGVPSSK